MTNYIPLRKCRSFWTWLVFYRRVCGKPAPRILGWDFYPRSGR